jgi:hypothetical protein
MMGGIAADELLNDVPRAANHNFDLRRGGDGTAAYKILRAAELNHDDAMEFLHQSIDDNKEYLAQPAVSGIISENENAREAGLSRQFHYSPERLQNMRTEVQRRIANAKNQPDTGINDNGTTGGGSAEVNSEDVARGEGGSPQATGAGVFEMNAERYAERKQWREQKRSQQSKRESAPKTNDFKLSTESPSPDKTKSEQSKTTDAKSAE